MGAVNRANLKKALFYLRRNGLRSTWYAMRESLARRKDPPYVYEPPSKERLDGQRKAARAGWDRGEYEGIAFSVIVPAYRTTPRYLRALMESVRSQSFPYWELIVADATEDDGVESCVEDCIGSWGSEEHVPGYQVVRYVRLPQNAGISGNTNEALKHAGNPYVGLLDHDDLLTPDALFEMAEAIRAAKRQGLDLAFLYSDEDKCDGEGAAFFDPNRKEKFNYDLILSNNYICHFMVMERGMMQKLQFRSEYDGAQDYDLILRAVTELGIPRGPEGERFVCHVPRVLYHWRCHRASTAENPRSKLFAYDAGRRALQDHVEQNHVPGHAVSLQHLGFYQVRYPGTGDYRGILAARPDVGIVGGPIVARGRIAGGRMDGRGRVFYEGLPIHYSGLLHRAILTQDAEAVDVRRMALREELHPLFREVAGVAYRSAPGEDRFDASLLPPDTDYGALSVKLCKAVRERGYRILWIPGGRGGRDV